MNAHIRKRLRTNGAAAWQVRIRDTGDEQVRTFDRKRDAEQWLNDRKAAKLRGDLIAPDVLGVTVSDLATSWVATWEGRLEPTSQRRYEQLMRLYVLPGVGSSRAATMTYTDVARFLAGLDGLAPSTVRKVHATLSAIFTEGIRSGLVRVNPCRHQRLPRVERATRLIVDADEVGEIATRLPVLRDAVAIRLAFVTGLRAGELWALRRRDIDVLHGRVLVSRALKNVGGRLEFGPTKTHQSRMVSVPRGVLQEVEGLLATRATDPEALLFVGAYGAPVRHNLWLRRVWRPAVIAALPEKTGLRFHDLRHSHGSDLLARGVPIHVVQKRLGHSSITMTVDVYGHLLPGADDDVARLLDGGVEAGPRPGSADHAEGADPR